MEIERWSYLGYVLKVELSEFASRLDVGEKEEPRMSPKFSVTAMKRLELQLRWGREEEQHLGEKLGVLF